MLHADPTRYPAVPYHDPPDASSWALASVVGIPPTLIASMYGMNFKGIPEYDWSWGYPYALALIALSAILPLVWFKLRGWI